MKAATLLIVLLANDGYWFGERVAEIRFEPVAQAPAGSVSWELSYGTTVRLVSGTVDVAPGRAATVRVSAPPVRGRSLLRLAYRYVDATGKALDTGLAGAKLFPDNVFADAPAALVGARVVVWGTEADPLAAFLTKAGVPHRALSGAALRLSRPDVILFGPGSLDALPTALRPPLEELARAGASVVVFRQERCDRVAGDRLVQRTVPRRLAWRTDHPLLSRFTEEDLRSLAPPGAKQFAVRLPADQAALELSWWPAEVAWREPAPSLDALMVTRTIGKGRLVLCQLPFNGDWASDPLGQTFLRAALEYAATPPGPTPSPSARVDPKWKSKPVAKRPEFRDLLVTEGAP